jgi:hypothetical protein
MKVKSTANDSGVHPENGRSIQFRAALLSRYFCFESVEIEPRSQDASGVALSFDREVPAISPNMPITPRFGQAIYFPILFTQSSGVTIVSILS